MYSYSIVSILGYVTVKSAIHTTEDVDLGYKVSTLPIFLNFIFTLILCSPFYSTRPKDLKLFNCNSSDLKLLVRCLIALDIIMSIYKGAEAYTMSFFDPSIVYEMRREGETINIFRNDLLLSIFNKFYGLYLSTYSVIIIYGISLFLHSKKRRSLLLIPLAILPRILGGMSVASRGDLFFTIMELAFFYPFLKGKFDKKTKVNILVISSLVLLSVIIYSMNVTESRFSGSTRTARLTNTESVVKYFGESHVNLCAFIYGQVKQHPVGERMYHLGFNKKFNSTNDERDYWDLYTGVPIRVFKTAFGDCYVEFGTIGAFVFIFAFVYLWKTLVFRRKSLGYFLPLIYFYYHICFFGLFDFYFTNNAFLSLFFLLIVCWIIKRSEIKAHKMG